MHNQTSQSIETHAFAINSEEKQKIAQNKMIFKTYAMSARAPTRSKSLATNSSQEENFLNCMLILCS